MEWKTLAQEASGQGHMELKRLELDGLMGIPIEPLDSTGGK